MKYIFLPISMEQVDSNININMAIFDIKSILSFYNKSNILVMFFFYFFTDGVLIHILFLFYHSRTQVPEIITQKITHQNSRTFSTTITIT
jgi:hypothetical protein